jgi:hypothetical protein
MISMTTFVCLFTLLIKVSNLKNLIREREREGRKRIGTQAFPFIVFDVSSNEK